MTEDRFSYYKLQFEEKQLNIFLVVDELGKCSIFYTKTEDDIPILIYSCPLLYSYCAYKAIENLLNEVGVKRASFEVNNYYSTFVSDKPVKIGNPFILHNFTILPTEFRSFGGSSDPLPLESLLSAMWQYYHFVAEVYAFECNRPIVINKNFIPIRIPEELFDKTIELINREKWDKRIDLMIYHQFLKLLLQNLLHQF